MLGTHTLYCTDCTNQQLPLSNSQAPSLKDCVWCIEKVQTILSKASDQWITWMRAASRWSEAVTSCNGKQLRKSNHRAATRVSRHNEHHCTFFHVGGSSIYEKIYLKFWCWDGIAVSSARPMYSIGSLSSTSLKQIPARIQKNVCVFE